ncbi:MAG: acetate--CoA ligase family protein [Candidatus Kapabacteria bacterium]|nr:acetate--CoA ligase family protein [Ignavibacteriota bacterium]MCW5884552.1 acetate--CoA ligase family protein [Candidatus Kapabacteria bacterium]
MVVNELINPKSIVIVGGSNDIEKPGGKILKNIIDGNYRGQLSVVNPKETIVQGVKCFADVKDIDDAELAIIAIPSRMTLDTIKTLAYEKSTKAFIILSAGFSEFGEAGKLLEQEIVKVVESVGGSLIGPNCIGIVTHSYKGVFAGLIPQLSNKGCDLVSGSGATICFILEMAVPRGLMFNSIFSVGNSAQIGVEEVLEYWDDTFDPKTSSKVKLFYIEQIHNPDKLLKHCRSLIKKGCRIAAIKAGTTEAGSRAVSSHTGALAGSDTAVEALFRKAGIIRCYSRQELVYVGGVLLHKPLTGKNIAVITHAGGSGVMLTDTLAKGGLSIPKIEGPAAEELLAQLYHGSSVSNPIDFLATGNADQLGTILEYVDREFHNIDASVVIFGTTGMFDVTGVYDVLHEKMKWCKKPIYPCLPSVVQAEKAVKHFLSLGRIDFTDEVALGSALSKIYNTAPPADEYTLPEVDKKIIREVIDNSDDGYLSPEKIQKLLDAVGIPRVKELIAESKEDALKKASELGFPLVLKVVGPIHKTDVGGVVLNVRHPDIVAAEFDRMMQIPDATGIMLQQMLSGTELFVGAKHEEDFGHIVLLGLGGIFIEVLKDISSALAPVSRVEALKMMSELKSYKLLEGVRKREGVNKEIFAEILERLSALLDAAPEIMELDLNPLLGKSDSIIAVDGRIRIEKK